MKKYIMSFIIVLSAVSLCACSVKIDEKKTISTETEKTETQVSDELEKAVTTEAVTTEAVATDAAKQEAAIPEDVKPESEPEDDETIEVTSEVNYPGADVVEIVNLRGDETTIYKLADGTYMDRIERRFTYNGTDTWTDQDGVEWNEVVK